MPPGLYEMVISPHPADLPAGGFVTGDWLARFEARSFDDLRALGRNSAADDRAFAAAARLSELNLAVYRSMMQPLVRALASQPAAALTKRLDPLRLSYTMFTDRNPWMSGVQKLAASVAAARKPVAADNPFLTLQTKISDRIVASLEAYRVRRDSMAERLFFGIYGAKFVQKALGINENTQVRPAPITSPEQLATQRRQADSYADMLTLGGFDEALTRAVLYVFAAEQAVDQRCALA